MILDEQNAETVGKRAIGEIDGRDRDPGARKRARQHSPNARSGSDLPGPRRPLAYATGLTVAWFPAQAETYDETAVS
jgi:hypothetical protein